MSASARLIAFVVVVLTIVSVPSASARVERFDVDSARRYGWAQVGKVKPAEMRRRSRKLRPHLRRSAPAFGTSLNTTEPSEG